MSEFDPARLPARLRQLRAGSGMRAEEIAYKAGCSVTHLRRVEDGGCNPSVGLLIRLAAAYGLSLAELVTIDADPAGAR